MKKSLLFIFIVSLFIYSGYAKNVRYKRIDNFLSFMNKKGILELGFSQSIYDYSGEKQAEYSGVMWYKPKRLFRIEYEKPDKEIIIVDGKSFKDYDFYDDEMNEGSLEDVIFISPFTLLKNVYTYFKIEKKGKNNFVLESKTENTGDIESITFEFDSRNYPNKMSVIFHSGSITIYRFRYMKKIPFQKKYFLFSTIKTFLRSR